MEETKDAGAVVAPVERGVRPARTKTAIRELASATLREHGMPLVRELNKGDNFDGGNLCALLELFAEKLLADDAPPGTHTFGSIMLTALETIATLPLEEQDNMMAANMRHVARMALDCRPNVRAKLPAEACGVSPGCKDNWRTAARAYGACRSRSA